jgi:pimeloyl-ACP methyl ester carboxylesterase
MKRRGLLSLTAAGGALAASAAMAAGQPAAAANAGPPFVLVHGAWHGGWCWRDTAALLRAAGCAVIAPTLTGLGDRYHLRGPAVGLPTHIDDVLASIETEELTGIVLVGHSYGGVVAEAAARARPGLVRALIMLDAVVLSPGERLTDGASPEAVAKLRADSTDGFSLAPPPPSAFGVPDGNREATAWLRRELRPHPIRTLEDAVPAAGGSPPPPTTYIRCTAPACPEGARWLAKAQARSWPVVEIATGHDAMVIDPALTARILSTAGGL